MSRQKKVRKKTASRRGTKAVKPGTARSVKVFRDAVHDLITLALPEDKFILDLIGTKEFQRLRRIRQLGLANLVYPCAEHSRFAHSLGVFNFARRIIGKLQERHQGNERITDALSKHAEAIKAAALLHDLGHGPFSHVFEHVFSAASSIGHEQWTCEIIRDSGTEVNEILSDNGIDANVVCSLVWDGAAREYPDVHQVEEPFIKDIVSSQLDADRMDYLLRDSLMTGARYGQYDSEWIVNALGIGEVLFPNQPKLKLCLDATKGTGAINQFLLARMLMTQHVYSHKTTRAYECELRCTLHLAAALVQDLPRGTPDPVREFLKEKGRVSVKAYLRLDDGVIWLALRQWATWKQGLPRARLQKDCARALQHHAMRLVRRKRPWDWKPISQEDIVRINAIAELRDEKRALRYEWWVDDGKMLPYKDLGVSLEKSSDKEQAFFEEIFLLEENEKTCRLGGRENEPIVQAFKKQVYQCRFFFDRRFSKEFAGLLGRAGVY